MAERDRIPELQALLDRVLDLIKRSEQSPEGLFDLLTGMQRDLAAAQQSVSDLREYCDRLLYHQSQLDARLLRLETNRLLRLWNAAATRALQSYRKLGQRILRSPLHPFLAQRSRAAQDSAYTEWVNREQSLLPGMHACCTIAAGWSRRPVISIIMPVYEPHPEWLEEAIRSVEEQYYAEWQLCIALDGPAQPSTTNVLSDPRRSDRIVIKELSKRGGIAAASNAASELANGQLFAFLDQDDRLSPYALYFVAAELQRSAADIIYTDEDRLAPNARRIDPIFKPDWSSELLYRCMYPGHMLTVAADQFRDVGGFRSEMDGAQDHDLLLRLSERSQAIRHIPKVLYHWRLHEGSTSSHSAAKPYAQEAGRRAVEAALRRHERTSLQVENAATPHTYSVSRMHADDTPVTIIICSKSPSLLERCVTSVRRTARFQCEFIVVHHETRGEDQRMRDLLARLKCRRVSYTGRFNFSVMNNLAAAEASTPYLLFLNDDIVATGGRWSSDLADQLHRTEVGVVGATLRYPSGAIQHAGIVIGIADGVGHPGRHQYDSGLWPWLKLTRNVSAVTGACMGMRAEVFSELAGFDADFPNNYNDVDICLRALKHGYEVICCAGADDLIHAECQTRMGVTLLSERDLFYQRWSHLLRRPDPFYSPSLAAKEEIALTL